MATIKYLGHSCFLVTTQAGVRIMTDPYEAGGFGGGIGYRPIRDEADVVLVTHEHADHDHVQGVPGRPVVLRGSGSAHGLEFRAVPSLHGRPGGQDRGGNRLFVWEADGLRFCHLGDLGFLLEEQQLAALGKVDVLFVPVGGHFTLDPVQASEVARQLGARLILPMHYRTAKFSGPLAPVEDFLRLHERVVRGETSSWEVEPESLPVEPTVVALPPAN